MENTISEYSPSRRGCWKQDDPSNHIRLTKWFHDSVQNTSSMMQIFHSIIGHEGIKRIQTEQKYQYVPQGYRLRTHSFYRKMLSFHHKIHIGTMYCLYPRQLMLMLILLSFVDLAYHQKNIVLPVFVVGQMECLELYL